MVTTLRVGNLPLSTTEDDLASVFAEIGEVISAKIARFRETGRSRGYGDVEMHDEDARRAVDELSGAMLHGRTLTVEAVEA